MPPVPASLSRRLTALLLLWSTTASNEIASHLEALQLVETHQSGHVEFLEALKADGFAPAVVFDVGACVLHWTRAVRPLWPQASFVLFDAFEPARFLYERDGSPHFVGVLSDRDGRAVEFFENARMPGGNSYYREVGVATSKDVFTDGHAIPKTAVRLDTVVADRAYLPPDLVKIDVQGAERDVLAGGLETVIKAE